MKYCMLCTNFVHVVFIFVIQLYRFRLSILRSALFLSSNIGYFFLKKWKNIFKNYEKCLLIYLFLFQKRSRVIGIIIFESNRPYAYYLLLQLQIHRNIVLNNDPRFCPLFCNTCTFSYVKFLYG
jgi:hypothetical protein